MNLLPHHWILLKTGAIILFVSFILFTRQKNKSLSISFLLLGSILINLSLINCDPFLNLINEQFHALVAKNMAKTPFCPMLYTSLPIMPLKNDWEHTQVWLFEQPLTLWQISLFLKLFGANEFALRLPSALMMTGSAWLIYKIGKNISTDQNGFIAALLFSCCYYMNSLSTGAILNDHLDICFLFYATGSIWAYTEFETSRKPFWIYLIGIFSGLAVLCNWLTGLFIFFVWTLNILVNPEKRNQLLNYIQLSKGIAIAFLIFIPWQIYISIVFPKETYSNMYSNDTNKIYESIKGLSIDNWFCIDNFSMLYGKLSIVLILPALVLLLRAIPKKTLKTTALGTIAIIYVLFTFLQKITPTIVLAASPFIFLAFASLLLYVIQYINERLIIKKVNLLTVACVSFILFYSFNIKEIKINHSSDARNDNKYNSWFHRKQITQSVKNLKFVLNSKTTVIMNCSYNDYISAMFYNNIIAYDFIPTEKQIKQLKQNKHQIAIFDKNDLPEYIKNDTDFQKITYPILIEQKRINTQLFTFNELILKENNKNAEVIAVKATSDTNRYSFELVFYDENICSIYSKQNQKYICSDQVNNGLLSSNRIKVGFWELFEINYLASNKIALRADNGKFIELQQNKTIAATATTINDNCIFYLKQ